MFQLETICWMCPLFVSPLTLCLLIISWQPLVWCSLRVLRFERRSTRSSNEISLGKVAGILAEDISEKSGRATGELCGGRIMNIPTQIRVIIKRVICVECWLSAVLPIVDPEKHGRMFSLPLFSSSNPEAKGWNLRSHDCRRIYWREIVEKGNRKWRTNGE